MFFSKNVIYFLSLPSRLLTGTSLRGHFTVYYLSPPGWLQDGEWRDAKAMNELSKNAHNLQADGIFRAPHTVCTHMSRYYTASDRSCSVLWVLFYGTSTRHCDLLNRHMFTPITARLACKFNRDSHFLPLYRKVAAVQSGGERRKPGGSASEL